MTPKLIQAVAAIERLPQDRQDTLAEAILQVATRALIDDQIAAGEACYASQGAVPVDQVFARLIAK